jgi:N-acetylneuraminate synthase
MNAKPYLIAEIGINANGSVDLAKQMIKAAAEAGMNAVKFQKRTVDLVYTKEFLDSPRNSPWGSTQRDQKMGLEFSREQYDEIDAYCKEVGISWSASAWDLDSFHFIDSFSPQWHKLASPMLGNMPLVRAIAKAGRKTFISTGMATLEEIDVVVDEFYHADTEFEVLHCCSSYPMAEHDANLLVIPMLRERYGCNVGWSGHEKSVLKVSIAAVALGATSIERHICISHTDPGSDQAASIEVHDLKNFVEVIREVPLMLGTGIKTITESEMPIRKKLRVEVL